MTFNWKNLVENLIITIVVFLAGAYVGHLTTKVTSESVVNILKPTIDSAINKKTVENSIYNAISNNFEKIKKSDSLKITISQEPNNDNRPNTTIQDIEDCKLTIEQYNKLTDGQKRRLDRWTE